MSNYHYQRILAGFKEWLELLNYACGSVKVISSRISELFTYLDSKSVSYITAIRPEDTEIFYHHLKARGSKNDGALLSNTTLNGYISSLQLLSRYLQETGQAFIEVDLPVEAWHTPEKEVLSIEEIRMLYSGAGDGINGQRDRAILGIYYGCGLRSNEGLQLDMSDILLAQRMLYVRKGKFGKERYVPFTEGVYGDIKIYMEQCRNDLLKGKEEEAFLLNNLGDRMSYHKLLRTFKKLQQNSADESLRSRRLGLHHLRHSIATHLLQKGMDIEDISYFLGHASVRSTQVYTHIAALLNNE